MSYTPTTSTVGYISQIRDGLIFSETFENANYAVDDNWSVLQGVATQSTTQSVDVALGTGQGIYSMPLSNLDISIAYGSALPTVPPVMFQTVQDTDQNNTMIGVWYYDTLNTSLPGPYMKVQLAGGQYVQLGVRNAVSISGYVAGGGSADTFQHITNTNRTAGWQLLQLIYSPAQSGSWNAYINNVQYSTVLVSGATNIVAAVYLQGDTFSSSQDSFGFFDDLNINRSTGVTFFGPGSEQTSLYVKNESYSPLVNFTINQNAPGVTSYNTINDYTGPADIWVEAAQATVGSIGGSSLETLLQLQSVNNGDYYKYNRIVLPYKFKTYDDISNSILQTNNAAQGQNENIVTGLQDKLLITARKLSGYGIYGQIQEFYFNARYGYPFSVAIDTTMATCVPIITGTVGSTTFTVGSVLGVTANNLQTNTQYVISDIYNQYRQYVTINNVNGNVVTLDGILQFNVGSAAAEASQYFIRPTTYYPALTLTAPSASDLKVVVPTVPRFDWMPKFQEYIYSQ